MFGFDDIAGFAHDLETAFDRLRNGELTATSDLINLTLAAGDQIVTSGSFLVDAETRLNPAAGSIYFGGSGGGKNSTGASAVRATTPDDPDAKITAALAKLSPADRKLAEQQRDADRVPGPM